VSWDRKTFERLRTAPMEPLASSFTVTHGMLLQVLSREGDGCRAMRRLIADCHETEGRKRQLRRKAWQLFRSLLERRIVEFIPPDATGRKLRVDVALQDDFSLHQTLSLYLVDTVPRLDASAPSYAVDVLALCEAIVEDPEAILRRQVDRLKTLKLEEMKAAGIQYEERMAKLDEIEHPKPLREFVYETFNAFAAAHPWVGDENIRPKSIAREMYERYASFADYVRDYGLERSEGLLLRHLAQVWKVLAQTVPDRLKSEEVVEMELYLRELVRGIDSSLLEEWERLRGGAPEAGLAPSGDGGPARPPACDVVRDVVSFRRWVRTAVFGFLQDVAARDWHGAAERLLDEAGPGVASEAVRIEQAFRPWIEARGRFRLDPEGRAAANTHWGEDETPGEWTVCQVLIDAEGANDHEAVFGVPLAASRAAGRAIIRFAGVRAIGTG
jgi:hypothetical protein